MIADVAQGQAYAGQCGLEAYQAQLACISEQVYERHDSAGGAADECGDAGTSQPHIQGEDEDVVEDDIQYRRDDIAPHSEARRPVQADDEQPDGGNHLEKRAGEYPWHIV